MPDNLPARLLTPLRATAAPTNRVRQAVAARRAVESGLLTVTHQQHLQKSAAIIEASAAADATKHCISVELDALAFGLSQVENSAAGSKLVADRLEGLSRANTAILSRRGLGA